ncbi:MAG: NAD(P)-dependent oxidoreductase [Gemmatimonadetes bacterium]|nr:NAD(P)-dependent oxidoreductase [Gemmatimonadota bacterium]
MLEHMNLAPSDPARVVVLGSGGFVGAASVERLECAGIEVLGLARTDLDLLGEGAASQLAAELRPDDALLVASAKAPVKDNGMLLDNITMMKTVCDALEKTTVAHVVYISSDAVYADSAEPMAEDFFTAPESLHGAMHLARELMLGHSSTAPLAILRPTLIYGARDPHNGYGPNRFRRLVAAREDIVLFGEGEERRDHVLVDDVAELVYRSLLHRGRGVLNIATGQVVSFRDIAEKVVALFDHPVEIKGTPRQGPMPHNGYRPFDPAATGAAFPDFSYTLVDEGLAKTHQQMLKADNG